MSVDRSRQVALDKSEWARPASLEPSGDIGGRPKAHPWVLAVVATPRGWCVVTTYSLRIRPDLLQLFWAGMQAGDFLTDAVLPLGVNRRTGSRILVAAGGVRPRRGRDLKGRCLTFAEREEIAVLRAQGESLRQIAAVIGRAASTVSRELSRNTAAGSAYRATTAHVLAYERASRPKPAKLLVNLGATWRKVEKDLRKKYSPEQISGRLKREFPGPGGDVGVDGDDLPVALRAVSRRAQPRSGRASAHRAGAAAPESRKVGAAQEPDPEHDQHLRAPARGRATGPCRAIGRAT